MHAGQLDQPDGEFVDHAERTLHRVDRLERVDVGKTGQPRHLLVEARVVLHRATAKREEAEVDAVILTRQAGVMAHGLGFGKARQADRSGARERTEPRGRRHRFGDINTRRA